MRAGPSRSRRWSRRSAPAPTRSSRFEQGRFIEFDRVPDYWARGSAGERRARTISTGFATNISATGRWRSRASRRARSRSARSSPRATGRPPTTFPAVREGRVKRETIPDDDAVGHAGLVLQHPPRPVQRTGACARRSGCCSISNGRTPTSCSARTSARPRTSRTPT